MKSTYLFENAEKKEIAGLGMAIVTVIESKGVTPRRSSRMIVYSDGTFFGTVGGGEAERSAVKDALSLIREGRSEIRSYDVHHGGMMSVMIDVVSREKKVYIFGSGHVATAMKEVFTFLKFSIHMVDAVWGVGEKSFKSEDADENTALIFTDHNNRNLFFSEAEKSRAFYIGSLSSRSKSAGYLDERTYMPAGLDIASDTPEEVAISIAAEVMAALNRKRGCSMKEERRRFIIVRGAGDLATAVIIRLKRAGYNVLALECATPSVIRRTVSLAEAVYDGETTVEGVKAILIDYAEMAFAAFDDGMIPVLIDEDASYIGLLKPTVVVDAIIAKKNLGTHISDAPLTIALGPGFTAPSDVDVVIETKRGHDLARIIREGSAYPNTGIPGEIEGISKDRVIHSPADGIIENKRVIGDIVEKGDVIAYVGECAVRASISGMLRGLIRDGYSCKKGLKIADIDPRGERADYLTISDKARNISGSVLEVVDQFFSSSIY